MNQKVIRFSKEQYQYLSVALLLLFAVRTHGKRGCKGLLSLGGKSGIITSPNYPQEYNASSDCEWTISVPANRFIKLTFFDFHLEGDNNCKYDFVEVRDGTLSYGPLLGKYCGKHNLFHVFSTSQSMFVRFRSDSTVNKKGFYAKYFAVVTKGNECEKNWHYFEESAYKFCDIPTTKWIDAQNICQNMGADLIKMSYKEENDFVSKIQKSLEFQSSWLGLIRSSDNKFYWSDGTKLNYTRWINNSADYGDIEKDCAELYGGYWRKVPCQRMRDAPRFFCEKKDYLGKCQENPLLLSNKAGTEFVLTASSRKSLHHDATNGMFSSTKNIWCPASNTKQEWIQVDLGEVHFVCGVAAVNDVKINNQTGVTWYRAYSSIEPFGNLSKMANGSTEFYTNAGVSKAVVHSFHRIARYLRFIPTRSRGWPCLKIEVYGEGKVPRLQMSIPITNKTVDASVISSTSFRCIANGYPSPTYTWFKDGKKWIPDGRLREKNSVLQLTRLDQNNNGWYTCRADNALGSINSTAYLMVITKAPPKVRGLPSRKILIRYTSSTLACEIQMGLTSVVTWYKDGKPVENNRQVNIKYFQSVSKQSTSIHIANTLYRDSGIYTCVFNNTAGVFSGNATVSVQGAPEFLTKPIVNQTVKEGDDIRLKCKAYGVPAARIRWKLNGKYLVNSSLDDNGTLVIQNVKDSGRFEGTYECEASNTIGNITALAKITIHSPPKIERNFESHRIRNRGQTVTLYCITTADPKPQILWSKDGISLEQTSRIYIQDNGQTLNIRRLERRDSGVYLCLAKNYLGNATAVRNITIFDDDEEEEDELFKPKIDKNRTRNEIEAKIGEKVELHCFSSSSLPVKYSWQINGIGIRDSINRRVNNNSLILTLRTTKDFGVYTCHVTNMVGSTLYNITVYQPRLKNDSTHPLITTPHETKMSVIRGGSIVIRCFATGNPKPVLEWWRNGIPLKKTARVRFQDKKQVLKIIDLKPEDSGLYVCAASNKVGTVAARSNVSVFGEPVINTKLTKTEVQASIGNATSIKCFVSNPLPVRYNWTKHNNAIHNSDTIKMYQNILVITPTGPEDFGVYVCHVNNMAGYTNYSISLVPVTDTDVPVAARKSSFGNLGLILAIVIPVAAVVIVVVTVIIVYISCRKRQH